MTTSAVGWRLHVSVSIIIIALALSLTLVKAASAHSAHGEDAGAHAPTSATLESRATGNEIERYCGHNSLSGVVWGTLMIKHYHKGHYKTVYSSAQNRIINLHHYHYTYHAPFATSYDQRWQQCPRH